MLRENIWHRNCFVESPLSHRLNLSAVFAVSIERTVGEDHDEKSDCHSAPGQLCNPVGSVQSLGTSTWVRLAGSGEVGAQN